MFKLIFIATLIVIAVSIPLDDRSNPPKDDSKDFNYFSSDGTDGHTINKRNSNVAAGHAIALKEQDQNQKTKRDIGTNIDTNPKIDEPKSDRKVRDTTKDKKPKRDIPGSSVPNPQPQPQPPKSVPVVKRDTGKDVPKKHFASDDKDHQRKTRSTVDDKDNTHKPKRDIPGSNAPHPPKTAPVVKRDTGKEDPKKHFASDDKDHQRKTRSTVDDKDNTHKPKRDTGKDVPHSHLDDGQNQRKTRSTDQKTPEHKTKRDTGKNDPKKHIASDDSDHQRKTRSTADDKDNTHKPKRDIPGSNVPQPQPQPPKPVPVVKRDTGKDDPKKHIAIDDNDHQRKSRAATDDKGKIPEHKPKREAKETKPDPKKQPPQKSGSSNGKH